MAATRYPCTWCTKLCVNTHHKPEFSIECSLCKGWTHIKCVPMDEHTLELWTDTSKRFVCRKCCYSGDTYNTDKAMKRLARSDVDQREAQAYTEVLLLHTYDIKLPEATPLKYSDSVKVDKVAVLGVDKTFNLGSVHVTVLVYKNLALINRKTGDHPLFCGPLFLHGNSDTATFSVFFQHLAGLLADCKELPVLGSDEEAAMRKAMGMAFPGSLLMCCSLHLQKNFSASLKDKVGLPKSQRQHFENLIFGSKGILASADDQVEAEDSLRIVSPTNTGVQKYFDRMTPLLLQNVAAFTTMKNLLLSNVRWTNNNCESINHVLKQAVNWKSLKLVELVNKLHAVVRQQYREVKRSFINVGEFALTAQFDRFAVSRDIWLFEDQVKRMRRFKKFMSALKMTDEQVVRSTDGCRTSRAPTHKGKKPGQVKRKQCAKTTSTPKKRKLPPSSPIANTRVKIKDSDSVTSHIAHMSKAAKGKRGKIPGQKKLTVQKQSVTSHKQSAKITSTQKKRKLPPSSPIANTRVKIEDSDSDSVTSRIAHMSKAAKGKRGKIPGPKKLTVQKQSVTSHKQCAKTTSTPKKRKLPPSSPIANTRVKIEDSDSDSDSVTSRIAHMSKAAKGKKGKIPGPKKLTVQKQSVTSHKQCAKITSTQKKTKLPPSSPSANKRVKIEKPDSESDSVTSHNTHMSKATKGKGVKMDKGKKYTKVITMLEQSSSELE